MEKSVRIAAREGELFHALFTQWAEWKSQELFTDMWEVCQITESPIEVRLAVALGFMPFSWDMGLLPAWYPIDLKCTRPNAEVVLQSYDEGEVAPGIPIIAPQAQVGGARVDFLIVHKNRDERVLKIVVECDGHDFHERTKEQAERDRSRDRQFQAEGFKVFRFTGSEIFRRATACAEEVADLIMKFDQGEVV